MIELDAEGIDEMMQVLEEKNDAKSSYLDDLVLSFVASYKPAMSEMTADEVFTIGALREYFSAYVTIGKKGDALPNYISKLTEHGFRLRTSGDGTPALFVNFRE